jgi:aspartyl-tRNA(Asn)/glutamyl-tRNA(Gln) amidotransferase subunit B
MGELAARLNKAELDVAASPVSPAQLAGLVARIADNTISNAIARKVFEALWNGEGGRPRTADEVIDKQGLRQVTDTGAIEAMIDEVLAANQKSVEEFRAGKEKAFNALVGQVMKASKGKASPAAGQRAAEEEARRLKSAKAARNGGERRCASCWA